MFYSNREITLFLLSTAINQNVNSETKTPELFHYYSQNRRISQTSLLKKITGYLLFNLLSNIITGLL